MTFPPPAPFPCFVGILFFFSTLLAVNHCNFCVTVVESGPGWRGRCQASVTSVVSCTGLAAVAGGWDKGRAPRCPQGMAACSLCVPCPDTWAGGRAGPAQQLWARMEAELGSPVPGRFKNV